MGVAWYPSFETEVEGYEPATAMSGKALARNIEKLDEICARVGVTPISEFYSESTEECFDKIGEDVPDDAPQEPVKWSEPADGIRTVDGLLAALDDKPDQAGVIEDLKSLREALVVASKNKTRFRLCIDI